MTARTLYYTIGSPFGRAVRIIMDEIGLEWDSDIANIKDTADDRARRTPALQVPTLFDGETTLWDSELIAEYLLANYPNRTVPDGVPPLAPAITRPGHAWMDKRLFATIQTFGQSTVFVSQTRWAGTTAHDNAFIARNTERIVRLIPWLEEQLSDERNGFLPDTLSVQDIFFVCHLMFITHRPLEIEWDRSRTPKLAALHDRLCERESFTRNGIAWWEPGMSA